MTYKGIDFCDHCGQRLEERQWLVGLCRACEWAKEQAKQKAKRPKRPVEILQPTKGLVS